MMDKCLHCAISKCVSDWFEEHGERSDKGEPILDGGCSVAETTKIEWADSTFNCWIGCTAIAPACDFCYAEAEARRRKWAQWGNHPRHRTSVAYWKEPLKWQRDAGAFFAEHGRKRRVFCASLADVFDNQVDPTWRDDLWSLIRATPDLIWMLLTKRPQNIEKMRPDYWNEIRGHVWLGTTVEDQDHDLNILHLATHDAAVRFISYEPALGPLDVSWAMGNRLALASRYLERGMFSPGLETLHPLDWVIAGGESGPQARPSDPRWFRSLRDQCAAAGVPFLFKQWGCWVTAPDGLTQHQAFLWAELRKHGKLSKPSDGWGGTGGNVTAWHNLPGGLYAFPTTKERAGRLLDDVEHNGFPEVAR
jgi:protein gp37